MDIMTKVRVLWEKVAGITADVSAVDAKATATAATLAGILPRIPADYSTEEVNTGIKWTDGKDIYRKNFSVTTGAEAGTEIVTNIYVDTMIDFLVVVAATNSIVYKPTSFYNSSSGNVYFTSTSSQVSSPCYGYVLYTKPDPVPAALDKGTGMITGEEPETKKRKTTKKEDK